MQALAAVSSYQWLPAEVQLKANVVGQDAREGAFSLESHRHTLIQQSEKNILQILPGGLAQQRVHLCGRRKTSWLSAELVLEIVDVVSQEKIEERVTQDTFYCLILEN